ncbi:hypothetical protein HPB52_000421 [Rhipicephalus sanguineus]|uniref:CCHC-type domain-containing protein n=1 Tax=Rhipicephalus sanguineus TaxID=34632 RepID=A0A9D4T845_RHISA|nr:hypothetical protein HPB52_000421 [Rhipicephalus sanguineus]
MAAARLGSMMEVVVEGQTITEEEYLSGSWTTLEAQRWCARQQPRADTDRKQTGSATADSEHRERGRPRFHARPPPLPKRKPLPKLPPADYKVIIRPQTAASLLHHGATELFKAVCAAAQVNPTEVVAEDQLRLHPTNNTALISTPSLDRAGRCIKLQVVKIGQQEIQVFAYAPAPENSTKGILYHACSDEDDAAILNELRARNKGIDIVGARHLGKSRHIVTIFAGADRPPYVRYWGATYVVYPFRDRIEACYNCRKVGHRTDVCPQQRQARCKRCGDETHATPEWGTKPTCLARCIVCKGGHPTGGDQENTTRITSATQPNSQSTGFRDAVRGTPLTEASQARQENATVLQQAPSGSREHSSSRGRAAAHARETAAYVHRNAESSMEVDHARNPKRKLIDESEPAEEPASDLKQRVETVEQTISSLAKSIDERFNVMQRAMQETLKTFHDMLKNEIRNMIPTLGNNIETPSTSLPLVIASANQTGGPQNGRGIPNGAADARSFAKKRAALQFAMTDLNPKIDVIALQETESAVKITGYTSFNELPTSNKSNLLQDAEEFTTDALAEEDGPRPDAKLITLLENQQTLQAEWLKPKHDRQLKLALAQAETEVQKYSQELRSAQWMQLCNRLNGQLGSKNPWFLFRHLLDPDNSKGATAKKLRKTDIAKIDSLLPGGSAATDTHKLSEVPQHSTAPVITPSAAEPVRVEQEARPVEADEAAEIQGETSGSGDDMSVTTATLKRARDETEEMDKTSHNNSAKDISADISDEITAGEHSLEELKKPPDNEGEEEAMDSSQTRKRPAPLSDEARTTSASDATEQMSSCGPRVVSFGDRGSRRLCQRPQESAAKKCKGGKATGAAPADTPKVPEALQHLTTPASAPSAVGPERVETDVVPVGAAETTEGQGETAADSEDEMCVTSATLKRPLDDSGELDGASSTNSQEPPAKAPQGRRLRHPYGINDFRKPLKDLGIIQQVSGIGAYQMSHVWFLNMKTDEAKNTLLDAGLLAVKDRPCLVVDPVRQEVRLKLHWVAFDVNAEAIRRALREYGEVREDISDKWRDEDFEGVESTTRFVRRLLREGVTTDRIPNQMRLGSGTALVVVPGRPPLHGRSISPLWCGLPIRLSNKRAHVKGEVDRLGHDGR